MMNPIHCYFFNLKATFDPSKFPRIYLHVQWQYQNWKGRRQKTQQCPGWLKGGFRVNAALMMCLWMAFF